MEKNIRAKQLFQKYLDRTATAEELDEMFRIFEGRSQFISVYDLFEQEWESEDLVFELDNLTLEKLKEDFKKQEASKLRADRIKLNQKLMWWGSGIAAGLALLIGVYTWIYGAENEVIYQTGYGETQEIVLEDQTTITLNANSRLVWKTDWRKTGIRELKLDGEAFFEVNEVEIDGSAGKNSGGGKLPFRVITPDLTVNVFGTSFNVVSRRQKTDVFLESGKVELSLNEGQDGKPKSNGEEQKLTPPIAQTILMEPGDAVSYSVSHYTFEQTNNGTTQNNASWIEGSLSFENERLEEVLNQLEDIYGKHFEVGDTALLNRKVNLGLPYEDWTTVSGLMTLTLEIEMKEIDGKVVLKK